MPEQQEPTPKPEGQEGRETGRVEDELETLRTELEEANKTGQEYLQLLQRVQADFNNYRRRAEQQRLDQMNSAKASVVLKVLPVLDDFDRALEAMPEEALNSDWGQGIALIDRKLRSALEEEGATPIEALGQPFDPWQHEAVDYVPTTNHKEGEVIEVIRQGYKLGDKVIRPAQVRVARELPG